MGEEVDYHFVSEVLKVGIEQWNHCVKELMSRLQDPRFLLALVDETVKEHYKSEKDLEAGIQSIQQKVEDHLQPISLKDTEGNLLTFGQTNRFIAFYSVLYILSLWGFLTIFTV